MTQNEEKLADEKLLEELIEKEMVITKRGLTNINNAILEMKRMMDENGTVDRFDVNSIFWDMKLINLDMQYMTRRIMSKTRMFYSKKVDEEVEKKVQKIQKEQCRDSADGKCGCMRRASQCW